MINKLICRHYTRAGTHHASPILYQLCGKPEWGAWFSMRRLEETNGARTRTVWRDIIHLTCEREAQELAEALQEEFGGDGLLITASGRTCKRDQGHLVVEW